MKPTVSLLQASSYELADLAIAIEKLLEPLGGMSSIVKAGDRVLLKPNLLTGSRPTKECTTRPEIIYCVAKMVQAEGGKPFLGDSPAFGTALGVAKANGLLAIAKELDIPIVEFHGERYQTEDQTEGDFKHLRLSKEAMNADVVINLPKVKSHVQLTITMGVKNLFGCVPGKMKAWWHLEAGKDVDKFARMLVATAEAIAPSLTIMDGIIGHEGNGPGQGEPRYLGMLAASNDVFALDRVVVEILGVDPNLVPTLKVGKYQSLDQIAIAGTAIENLQVQDWKLPTEMIPIDFGFPRIIKSTFKHLYIKFIKEPMAIYAKS